MVAIALQDINVTLYRVASCVRSSTIHLLNLFSMALFIDYVQLSSEICAYSDKLYSCQFGATPLRTTQGHKQIEMHIQERRNRRDEKNTALDDGGCRSTMTMRSRMSKNTGVMHSHRMSMSTKEKNTFWKREVKGTVR